MQQIWIYLIYISFSIKKNTDLKENRSTTCQIVTSLYYSTVSGENIGTSLEVITELSNLIMTVIVAYAESQISTGMFPMF
jgi:hypothetical protein